MSETYPELIDTLIRVRAAMEKKFIRMANVAPREALRQAEENNFRPVISAAAKNYWEALRSAGPFPDDLSAWNASEQILAKNGYWLEFGVTEPVNTSSWESDSSRISRLIKVIKEIAAACTLIRNIQADPDFQFLASIVVSKAIDHDQ
jgi:hypothetical protein